MIFLIEEKDITTKVVFYDSSFINQDKRGIGEGEVGDINGV